MIAYKLVQCALISCLSMMMIAPIARGDDAADIAKASRAAEKFINDYVATTFPDQRAVIAWVNKRQDVFPIFKERLSKLYLDALKADPECGYGADAILSTVENAGTKYRTVDTFYRREHIRVTLKAIAPPGNDHKVDVVMMEDGGRWLVQSCGDIPM